MVRRLFSGPQFDEFYISVEDKAADGRRRPLPLRGLAFHPEQLLEERHHAEDCDNDHFFEGDDREEQSFEQACFRGDPADHQRG